jgi:protein-tyrosine phosphatase
LIDLHCHVLPGLDDGPPDLDHSVALVKLAAADGIARMAATPHVREDYTFPLGEIEARADQLNERLREAGVPVTVMPAAEVATSKLQQLDDATLASLCLGSGSSLLVESPYQQATDLLEETLFTLQLRGFRPVLAHPERSPSFMKDPDRLATLVERGILCSVTAASMAGRFGRTVQGVAKLLFERGLVHDVASDAHDIGRRAPGLTAGFRLLEKELPGLTAAMPWFTTTAPEAILAGQAVPQPPRLEASRKGLFRRR